jgi:hypothetical protein
LSIWSNMENTNLISIRMQNIMKTRLIPQTEQIEISPHR